MESKKYLSKNHKGWFIKIKKLSNEIEIIPGNIEYDSEMLDFGNRVLYTDQAYFIIFDGSLLNNISKDELLSVMIDGKQKDDVSFLKNFNGCFSGIIIDWNKQDILCFADRIGSRQVYYADLSNEIIISSDIASIYDYMNDSNITNTLDISSAYSLLSCGYLQENNTLSTLVKRIIPGSTLLIKGNVQEIPYYSLDNTPKQVTMDEAIEMVEHHFTNACNLQYSSILNWGGYLVALSGGLDSRMTSLIGHDLGYTKQLNMTFSQSGYSDQIIAQQISSDYNHDWLFKSLDSGRYLMDIDIATEYSGGSVLYYMSVHSNSMFSLLNLKNFGMYHTGQLGDVVLGTYYSGQDPNKPYDYSSGAFSQKLIKKIDKPRKQYPNEEIGKFYNRGFNGIIMAGGCITNHRLENFSPFLENQFLETCLHFPLSLRFDHKLYKEWIIRKHPEIAKYKWEKINARITTPSIIIKGRSFPITDITRRIRNKVKHTLFPDKDLLMTKFHMNPLAWHIHNNPEVGKFINDYIKDNMTLLSDKELNEDVGKLASSSNSIERLQAISLLAAIKRFNFK